MSIKSLRDLFGEPERWQNLISDDENGMPDMNGASILDVFVSGNQVAIYTRSSAGVQALAIFRVDDQDVRSRVESALQPGLGLHEALAQPI